MRFRIARDLLTLLLKMQFFSGNVDLFVFARVPIKAFALLVMRDNVRLSELDNTIIMAIITVLTFFASKHGSQLPFVRVVTKIKQECKFCSYSGHELCQC